MDYLRTDEEQGEALKQWLKKNGLSLFVVIAISAGSVLGYKQWEQYKTNEQSDAAGLYQELIELSVINFADEGSDTDYDRMLSVFSSLRENHNSSNYAALGAGIVAAQAVEKADFDLAVSQLTFAESALDFSELKALVSLRLARIELELGESEAALKRIRSLPDEIFKGSAAELEGDILIALDQTIAAREVYLRARAMLTDAGLNTAIVDLKLSALPEG